MSACDRCAALHPSRDTGKAKRRRLAGGWLKPVRALILPCGQMLLDVRRPAPLTP
jgi:hypothetical protein